MLFKVLHIVNFNTSVQASMLLFQVMNSQQTISIFFKFFVLFLAALGLRCCARASSGCGERGLHFVVVRGLLTAVASLVAEHRL